MFQNFKIEILIKNLIIIAMTTFQIKMDTNWTYHQRYKSW
jgi:hypothetical protein